MTISYRFCLKNQRKHKFQIQFLKHMLGENIKCKPTIYRTVAITKKNNLPFLKWEEITNVGLKKLFKRLKTVSYTHGMYVALLFQNKI